MQVIVDGKAIAYDKFGSGRTLVLVHGWGDSRSTFNQLLPHLIADYTVVMIDLPGFGDSDSPDVAYDLESYASCVKSVLEKINCSKVFGMIGHSNGGAIIIKGASLGTLNADKLILIASSGVRSTQSSRKLMLRILAKVLKTIMVILPLRIQIKLKHRMYGAINSDLYVAPHMQDTFKKLVGEDIVQASSNISTPSLLIYGEDDSATPPKYGEMFHASMHNSRLEIVKGAGHFVHQTHALIIAPMIIGLLEE